MTHLTSIAAAMFTDLSVAGSAYSVVSGLAVLVANAPAALTSANAQGFFTTATSTVKYLRVPNVRSFPAIGAPANIVNVPVFGQRTSQTVGGQADAPSLEVTVNYVPSEWRKGGATQSTFTTGTQTVFGDELANMVGDGNSRVWRMTLLAAAVGSITTTASLGTYDSATGSGIAAVANSQFFWIGKLESLLVTPSLTDASTATLAMSIQSDFVGPLTST
jgi:hypothetical protein